jgi:SAM-dependent methyltransferase
MPVRDIIRPIPGVRQLSLLRQRLDFTGSADFWERRYARGGTSGSGSYGTLAHGKADFLNAFVQSNNVQSVIEFGCGDGNQLSLAKYPSYVGLDVSRTALGLCKRRFAEDPDKSFFFYDSSCFVDHTGLFKADLALSLDVIYHLIEDSIFEEYMAHLFGAGNRFAIVYTTNEITPAGAPHVRHRRFSSWVDNNCPQWRLKEVTDGPGPGPQRADFFVYEQPSEPS